MKFDFLSNHPEHKRTIAEWHFDEWGSHVVGGTLDQTLDGLNEYCRPGNSIPFALLALDNDELAGVAQLKHHELKTYYPDLTPWLGGVYVPTNRRNLGIARKLVSRAIELAVKLGVERIYLHTKQLDGGIYKHLGWKPLFLHQGQNSETVVMELHVNT